MKGPAPRAGEGFMKEKPFRHWAYHHEVIWYSLSWGGYPDYTDPRVLRSLRRKAKKQARRVRRRAKRGVRGS